MLTIIFSIFLIIIFGRLLSFSLKASWGIAKILLTIVFLPLILVGMVIVGLIKLALPILFIIGLAVFIMSIFK